MGTATTGYEDLKNIAVGRLFLDNVPHIKTHWPMVTPFLSQIALSFGCDDVEGTVVYERVYHEAGAHTQMHMPYLELVRLIRGAGKRPVERDSLYQPVREEFDDPPPRAVAPAGRRAAGGARRMRLGRIPWINCYPIYGAIDRGLVRVPAELVTGTASELNDLLAAGELQVSVVSAVEYARNAAAYHLLPDLAITCDGPVHSVALFSRAPGRRSSTGARCSAPRRRARRCCCSICIARHRWNVRPRYATARAEAADLDALSRPAARGGARHRRRGAPARRGGALSGPGGSRRRVEGVDGAAVRVRGLGGPPGGRARRRCRRCIGGCSSRAPGGWPIWTSSRRPRRGTPGWPEPVCRAYLGDLDYALSYRHLAGLTDFFRRLAQEGLVPDGSLSFISAA